MKAYENHQLVFQKYDKSNGDTLIYFQYVKGARNYYISVFEK